MPAPAFMKRLEVDDMDTSNGKADWTMIYSTEAQPLIDLVWTDEDVDSGVFLTDLDSFLTDEELTMAGVS